MENFIFELINGDKFHLKTDYKRLTVHNRMAMLYYIKQFSQVSRNDIKSIEKTTDGTKLNDCSLIITITKDMVRKYNKA